MAGKFWTDMWQVVTGCDPVSPGCDNCYAAREAKNKPVIAAFNAKGITPRGMAPEATPVRLHPEVLEKVERWTKPRRIFVAGMSDLWHHDVPAVWRDAVRRRVVSNPRHRAIYCTKRAEEFDHYFNVPPVGLAGNDQARVRVADHEWFMVTAENQEMWDARAHHAFSARVFNVGMLLEPLLGPIDMDLADWHDPATGRCRFRWVIVGAETGPGARECKAEWIEAIATECYVHGVPCWVKAAPALRYDWAFPRDYRGWPRNMPAGLRLPWEVSAA
jgi:protein gp37